MNGLVAAVPALPLLLAIAGCGGNGTQTDAGHMVCGARSWTKRTPSSPAASWPPGLWHVVMAPDVDRGEVLLFGGILAEPAGRSNQAWSWNGATGTWTNRTPSPLPASWPAARSDHTMTWDPVRHRIVMFGGWMDDFTQSDELWEWNGAAGSWTNLTPTPRPIAWPEARYGHAATYDAARGRLLVVTGFAGMSPRGYEADVWEWSSSGGTWTNRAPDPLPTIGWVPPRQDGVAVFDPARGKTLLFGGWDNTLRDDAWEWDGLPGTWADRTPATRPPSWPPAGLYSTLQVDPCGGRLLLLGSDGPIEPGMSADEAVLHFTAWDGVSGTWTNLAPSPLPADWPPVRQAVGVAWDPASSGIVFFGGQPPLGGTPLADTWVWR
jgi:hypothetical protein